MEIFTETIVFSKGVDFDVACVKFSKNQRALLEND